MQVFKPKAFLKFFVYIFSSPSGNLVADSMARVWNDCSIALINDGGIRTGLEQVMRGEDI